jgi:hypothetical protein
MRNSDLNNNNMITEEGLSGGNLWEWGGGKESAVGGEYE